MGYYHFYRIFENKIMMINHSLSDCPSCGQSHIWQKVIWYTENGQRGKRQIASIKLCLKSDGKRKETDILLLQTHTSAFNTNFILLTALKTALNLSSCHPPAIAQTLTQPCIGDQHREKGNVCLCVPFCWWCARPESDSRAAEPVPYTALTAEPPSHHWHCKATLGNSVHYFRF